MAQAVQRAAAEVDSSLMKRLAPLAVALALILTPGPTLGHGIWGHIHVTGWAIESLPDGELRDFFAEPEVFNAALFGAAFTDSGYFPQGGEQAAVASAYSEHTHWEPFINDFITWIRLNDPPPWRSLDSRKRVAFLLGCAAHGLQDEIFDSLFLPKVHEHDGKGQDEADPGSDGFMSHENLIRFQPTPYVPMETLLELYAGIDKPITADVIQDAVDLMTLLYVNSDAGPEVAATLYDQYANKLPWAFSHFMDPRVPGSLQSEVLPTAAYLQAVWRRLHGTFSPTEARVATYPAPDGVILGASHASSDAWVTYIYGIGTQVSEGGVTLEGQDGAEVPVTVTGTFAHPPRIELTTPPSGGGDGGLNHLFHTPQAAQFYGNATGSVLTMSGSHTFAGQTFATLGFTANQTAVYTVAETGDTLTLTTGDLGGSGGAIPEPSTICVWSVLLIGAVGMTRRRKS